MYQNSTISNDGTLLPLDFLLGVKSTNQNSGGGSNIPLLPLWLAKDSTYLFNITNSSGQDITFNYRGTIYEIDGTEI